MIVSPKPVRRIVATFANGTPSAVCSHAAHASARGPTWEAAAQTFLDVLQTAA